MQYYGVSDTGLLRSENQDSYFVLKNKNNDFMAVVCDGIGGANAGEVASNIATKHLQNCFQHAKRFQNDGDVKRWLLRVIQEANDKIFSQASKEYAQSGMGTTCVGAIISDLGTYIFNVGDSRLYGLYDEFICLTEDHSYIADLLKNGKITEEEALCHPNKNMLTNALGIWNYVKIDINKIKDDYHMLLICSDGLHGYVEEMQIETILRTDGEVENKAKALITLAQKTGGYDNVSVIVIEKGESDNE